MFAQLSGVCKSSVLSVLPVGDLMPALQLLLAVADPIKVSEQSISFSYSFKQVSCLYSKFMH